jgi:hypothetical protein
MESLFLLAFSDEEVLAALAMASSEAFFNKLLVLWSPLGGSDLGDWHRFWMAYGPPRK